MSWPAREAAMPVGILVGILIGALGGAIAGVRSHSEPDA
jgi:hypothetical protein